MLVVEWHFIVVTIGISLIAKKVDFPLIFFGYMDVTFGEIPA